MALEMRGKIMVRHIGKEKYERKLSELHQELSEIDQELSQNGINLYWTDANIENWESVQSIINSIKEAADIVNHTVSPMEFFDGYDKMYYLVDKLESVPDISYSQQPPNKIRIELQGQRKPAIRNMIGRYYNHVMSMDGSTDVFYNNISKYFSYMDDDHKNYVNQLCKNGNKKKKIRKFKDFYRNFSFVVNRILLPPAKIMFVIWTVYWINSLSADTEISFGQRLLVILFGYLIMCGIADLLYYMDKKKYNKYMVKILERKMKRLKKSMQEIDPIRYEREYGNTDGKQIFHKNNINYDYMDGHQFEYFCADVLRKNGFKNVEVTQGSGDHGIDILAEKDGITYAIQCKCYSDNIGNAAVQQAHTGKSLYHKDIAVVMTNRYFTAQAIEEAMELGVKLWDRDRLNGMIENQ